MNRVLILGALSIIALQIGMTTSQAEARRYKDGVNQRLGNQESRIANGLRKGTLSPRQAANLDQREAKVMRQDARDRQLNGGTLTPQERGRLEQEENRDSQAIYRDKHE